MSILHNDPYYYFEEDLNKYNAWCYIVWSQRGPGKTYSSLKYAYQHKIPIIYMKRTNDDVEFICKKKGDEDFSPYKPINRDIKSNIQGEIIDKGIGVFYDRDSEGERIGGPVSYCLSLNAIKKIKGFDASECMWVILDEFIPQAGEVVKRKEGEMLLDLYMTIRRDRVERGLPDLKLILFANAEEVSTPITNTLDVVDTMVEMESKNQRIFFDQERGILLHHITPEECPVNAKTIKRGTIEAAMMHTSWGAKALGGQFANNDFSSIKYMNVRGMKPVVHLCWGFKHYYIYLNENSGHYHMTKKKNKCRDSYNLNKENDQKRFWLEYQIDLKNACIDGRMSFESYSMYDHIINYKKFFLTS